MSKNAHERLGIAHERIQDQRSQILNHVLLIIVSKLLHESGIVFLLHAFRVNKGLNGVFIAVIGHEGLGQSRVHIDL